MEGDYSSLAPNRKEPDSDDEHSARELVPLPQPKQNCLFSFLNNKVTKNV
jgi:hypothetical protein